MKKKFLPVWTLLCLGLLACGPDSDLVASGVHHTCAIKELQTKMAADPMNEELKNEFTRTVGFLESVIKSADEADREELRKAIQDGSQSCK